MIICFLLISGMIILLSLVVFLPYLPGSYDASAVPVSYAVQISLYVSLLLLPAGAWGIFRFYSNRKYPGYSTHMPPRLFILYLQAVGLLIIVAGSLAFAANRFYTIGIVCLFTASLLIYRMGNQLKKVSSSIKMFTICTSIVFVPLSVLLIRQVFIKRAIHSSITRVIAGSEALNSDIELYRNRNGYYPVSLHSLWTDYPTGVRGVSRFFYERNGESYNLFFEIAPHEPDIRAIVMYNNRDEHAFSSHDMDLLQLSPEEISLQRGFISKEQLPEKHWKYFRFD